LYLVGDELGDCQRQRNAVALRLIEQDGDARLQIGRRDIGA
jgi:hypothetical protein